LREIQLIPKSFHTEDNNAKFNAHYLYAVMGSAGVKFCRPFLYRSFSASLTLAVGIVQKFLARALMISEKFQHKNKISALNLTL
jgi:hypothetical protein